MSNGNGNGRMRLGAFYGASGMAFLMALVAVAITGSGRHLVPPILRVVPTDITVEEPLCPGQSLEQDIELRSRRPAVLSIVSAIYNERERRVIPGTEKKISSPIPVDWNELPLPLEFDVPNSPDGLYRAVFAISPSDSSAELAFVNVKFVIERCK